MKKTLMVIGLVAIGFVLIMSARAQATVSAVTWDLTAGKTIKAGTVTVSNDGSNLYVTYALTFKGATFGTLHMWAGTDIAMVPANKQGIPVPGQFPWKVDATGLTTSTLAIPLSSLGIAEESQACGKAVYVVTHAEVNMDSNGDGKMELETAFGGDIEGDGPRWWFYGDYAISCEAQYSLITLKTFTATYSGGKVTLKWATASEFENAGFYIVKFDGKTGEYERINPRIVPAKGTVVKGSSYSYADKDIKHKKTYYYKLEDVDIHGTSTFHGPVQVIVK